MAMTGDRAVGPEWTFLDSPNGLLLAALCGRPVRGQPLFSLS
jgi:hypothetical protein